MIPPTGVIWSGVLGLAAHIPVRQDVIVILPGLFLVTLTALRHATPAAMPTPTPDSGPVPSGGPADFPNADGEACDRVLFAAIEKAANRLGLAREPGCARIPAGRIIDRLRASRCVAGLRAHERQSRTFDGLRFMLRGPEGWTQREVVTTDIATALLHAMNIVHRAEQEVAA